MLKSFINKTVVSLLLPCIALVLGSFSMANESIDTSSNHSESVLTDIDSSAVPGESFKNAKINKVKGNPNVKYGEVSITDENGNDHTLYVPWDSSLRRELQELARNCKKADLKTTNDIITGIS